MEVFYNIEDYAAPAGGGSAVTLGCFDGVHSGHREIIKRVIERRDAQGLSAGLITFDPPPVLAIDPASDCRLITTADEKIEMLESLGLDWTLVIKFNEEFMRVGAEDFLHGTMLGKLGAKAIIVGHDVGFGWKRRGNEAFLRAESARIGFGLEVLEAVPVGEEIVSSTAIRKLVFKCDFERAAKMLGRPFSFRGKVAHDRQIGRTIGVPTANLDMHPFKLLPPNGIYAVRAIHGGEARPAVMSIGVRPTVTDEGRRTVEVHILDFDADIYDTILTVEPVKFLRPEMKFGGLEELKARIAEDIALAREVL